MNLLMACTKLDMMAKTSTSNCSMVDTGQILINPRKTMVETGPLVCSVSVGRKCMQDTFRVEPSWYFPHQSCLVDFLYED